MKKFALLATVVLSFTISAFATTPADVAAVKKASLNYIEGFYEGDDSKIKAGVSTELNKHGFWKNRKSGKYEPAGDFPFSKALEFTANVRKTKRFAKPDDPKIVQVLGIGEKIAITKITVNWGMDYMLLAKNDGKWMIRQVLWEGPKPTFVPNDADKKAAMQTGQNYIDGFYKGDSSKLKTALRPTMFKFGYGFDRKKGEFRKGNQMTYERAIAYANTVKEKKMYPKPGSPNKVEVLDIMNHTAAIKVTAWWGFDYMLLSRDGNKWMIEQVIWSGIRPKKSMSKTALKPTE